MSFVYGVAVTSLTLIDGAYGDVTVSGSGTVMTIPPGSVTLAKMANIATDTLIGRDTAGTGVPEAITLGASLSFGGSGTIQRAALTGDVTASANGNATTIAANAVDGTKLADIATDSLIGRDTAGTGDPEAILLNATLSMDGSKNLQRAALTGDVTASAGSNATTIANDAVSYAKMQNVSATDKVLGRSSAGAGDPQEIACTAAGRALIDDASASDQRTTLGLGALATKSIATFDGSYYHFFSPRDFSSSAGTLAVADAGIDDATDPDGHTTGVLMSNLVQTWAEFQARLPSGFGATAMSVRVCFRLQAASSASGDTVDLDVLGMVSADGEDSIGGTALSDSSTIDVDAAAAAGVSGRLVMADVGSGAWFTLTPDSYIRGVVQRDARITNGSDTYEQAIRLIWIRFTGVGYGS